MTTERDREMAREWLLKLGIPFDHEEDSLARLLATVRAEGVKAERAAVAAWLDANTEWYRADAAIRNGEHVTPREAEE